MSIAAATTAIGAVACGVCCVLPFAWPAVAAAGAGGALAWVGRAHGVATSIALVIVMAAWLCDRHPVAATSDETGASDAPRDGGRNIYTRRRHVVVAAP